jgi:hypothetical protein
MRLFYYLRAKFREWNYKRKYGISIYDALECYGKNVLLTKEKIDD